MAVRNQSTSQSLYNYNQYSGHGARLSPSPEPGAVNRRGLSPKISPKANANGHSHGIGGPNDKLGIDYLSERLNERLNERFNDRLNEHLSPLHDTNNSGSSGSSGDDTTDVDNDNDNDNDEKVDESDVNHVNNINNVNANDDKNTK